jgi:hypothetical protein
VVLILKEVDPIVGNAVNQTMFLRDAPRPAACQNISERLRFSDAVIRIAHYRFNKVERPECRFAVGPDPVTQVFEELGLVDSRAFTRPGQP